MRRNYWGGNSKLEMGRRRERIPATTCSEIFSLAKKRKRDDAPSNNVPAILTIIGQIPSGRVASYGQIAKLAGIPRNARQVGAVLRALPRKSDTPWHRIVNSNGEIAARGNPQAEAYQRIKLEEEGVTFTELGRVSINQFGWCP
ncbi:MAG: methylated-DNA-protein-cysteine methyltransferase-like protein [Mariniblastus sp.]|jgi:methylated-DNA-protein-cysteine methyltransferase-like protein